MAGSVNEMAEVIAAKLTKIKKMPPNSAPSGICPNASGTVTNMSPGPLPGSSPLAKTIEKIARPAIKATTVSRAAMVITVRVIETELGT